MMSGTLAKGRWSTLFWIALALSVFGSLDQRGLTPVLAQGREPLKLTLSLFLVVQEEKDGQVVEVFKPTLGVKPGDVVEWRLEVENTEDRSLRQVALSIPIPKEYAYLEGSALPLSLGGKQILPQFSYDGGKTYGFPPSSAGCARLKTAGRWSAKWW